MFRILRKAEFFLSANSSENIRKYCYVGTQLNYTLAEKHCNTLDGVLFEPRNEEVNSIVYNISNEVFGNGYQIWIGINDREKEDSFVYTSNGDPVTYLNWSPNQPDDSTNEDCVEFRPSFGDAMWNDFHCEYESQSICEKSSTSND